MENKQQPEALRLASELEQQVEAYPQISEDEAGGYCSEQDQIMDFAAIELRRLHAESEQHLQELAAYRFTVENLRARVAELEEQLAAAPQAVQAEVPEAIEQMAVDRYKVVPSHESMFHRWAVVAGNGTQQLYIGREVECLNMARKFAGAFLDGAFVAMQNTAPAHPAEGVPAQAAQPSDALIEAVDAWFAENTGLGGCSDKDVSELAEIFATHPTQPAARGMEADLTDEQIDETFNQMPDGAAGFLKSWGYRQFARAVLAAQAKQGGAA